ncbi:macrolide-specific efflux system membrane fusion protein [Rhodopirellula rubra]|uniref:Macrolide-specific efflux system membrane fusion protein n=1 Tax=Aporhodopirellula rubra TaxID=980271 RepID=A0A7W5H663_9BACT|nr:biotin/lipoyl-binding protein [Aporhodopirellula rubra]MBB3206571.1 macrolide-specific efflux system membrane fusion protein [Aporhodopirellula rubra]
MCPSHSPEASSRTSGFANRRLDRIAVLALLVMIAWAIFPKNSSAEEPVVIDQAQVLLIQNTTLATSIPGRIRAVEISEGDRVQVDQVIVRLDDRRARAEYEAAQASLRAAMIQAENSVNTRYAERTLEVRERELQQSDEANQRYAGSVTATEIDRLRLVIDQAELSVEQSEQERAVAEAAVAEKEAACELARLRIQEHAIASTIPGRAAEVFVQNGQWVEAGEPIARLISLDPIRVSGFVDGRHHDSSLVGRRVRFEIDRPDQPSATKANSSGTIRERNSIPSGVAADASDDEPEDDFEQGVDEAIVLYGVVTFISPELNPVTSQVRVWATVENSRNQARPGMRGKLKID